VPDVATALAGLVVILVLATATWVLSLVRRDVSIVDSLWGLLFVAAAVAYTVAGDASGGARRTVALVLVTVWGVRLAGHITWRNAGHGEDPRYRAMRRKHGPRFAVTSLVRVFWLQGALAWLISLPLLYAVDSGDDLDALAVLGVAVWLVGFAFEAVGDVQLARFKADPANAGQVMDRGLWRYTRHPNYFGDSTQWWGFWLLAVGAGGWWTALSPVLMTFLLLRVSGVPLLERGMARTRPAYAAYAARTSAFVPAPPRRT